jgi:hypothetical protein
VVEYRRSAHAVTDLKYHLICVNEVSVQDSAGRHRGAGARPAKADLRGAGGHDYSGRGLAGSCPHAGGGTAAVVAVEAGAVPERAVLALTATSSPRCASGTGGNTCGRAATTARVSVRWTKKRSGTTSRTNGGTRTWTGSRSPRRPSLKPAREPEAFKRLQPQPDFQSVRNLPALAGRF